MLVKVVQLVISKIPKLYHIVSCACTIKFSNYVDLYLALPSKNTIKNLLYSNDIPKYICGTGTRIENNWPSLAV